MSTVTIALLQMTACGDDQDANLAKGETFCRRAREMGADVPRRGGAVPQVVCQTIRG